MLDTFRQEYKPLNPSQQAQMADVKAAAAALEELILRSRSPENGREIALAITNLEQSVMWAVKGITA